MGCGGSKKKDAAVVEPVREAPPAPKPEPVIEEVKIEEPVHERVEIEEEKPQSVVEEVVEENLAPEMPFTPMKESNWYHKGDDYEQMINEFSEEELLEIIDGDPANTEDLLSTVKEDEDDEEEEEYGYKNSYEYENEAQPTYGDQYAAY
eukprot:GHVL01033053.1.p1 GENE.GHVL01033053.1~~GHVL01033053.1.p1  ORF type:complete len:149 (-),score=44.85 GHVL01033053.1:179-625(-)